ncbi:MAG: sugar transferase [Actinobacteria bacterium]|nr:sugar transferase [Actinomycetota bacterium]
MIAISLILLSPLFVVIGLLVKLTDGGPILHIARRMGRYGRTFGLFKFRTMVVGAAAVGPGVTGATDARVTRIGAFLRRTKLDELPQLVNVLRGEMELVGPRPEDPRYLSYYTRDQLRILDVRPGITSPTSIAYADESQILVGDDWEGTYVREVLPAKLDMELMALHECSFWEEVREVLHTLWVLARRDA